MAGPTLAILQPNYLPWVGNFDLVAQSDIWVWFDDVQYTRRDWRNRNRVAGAGDPIWLTVPVKHGSRDSLRICDVEIDQHGGWGGRHLETIRHCYTRAPHFGETFELIRRSLEVGHGRLADLAIELNEKICAALGLRRTFVRSSTLAGITGAKTDRLLAICEKLGAGSYLSGPAAGAYLEAERFRQRGIEVRYAVYQYPRYERGDHPFVERLSIVDPLCWVGASEVAGWLARPGGSAAVPPMAEPIRAGGN